MKKILLNILVVAGLAAMMMSCETDVDRIILDPADIVAPTIVTMPNLVITEDRVDDTLVFIGTPVDPGFPVSATYHLEIATAGANFEGLKRLASPPQDSLIKVPVKSFYVLASKVIPKAATTSADFRITAEFVTDGGTGALGSVDFAYSSPVVTSDVTLY